MISQFKAHSVTGSGQRIKGSDTVPSVAHIPDNDKSTGITGIPVPGEWESTL